MGASSRDGEGGGVGHRVVGGDKHRKTVRSSLGLWISMTRLCMRLKGRLQFPESQ